MIKYLYILATILFLTSCSEYQKALKTTDVEKKTEVFKKLILAKKYNKANGLFEQFGSSMRGKPQAEESFYMYADALYKTKQYISAAYQYESYASQYPKSVKAEQAAYMAAECYAKTGAIYSLDQVDAEKSLSKLQEFVYKYPKSEYLPKVNALVKELNEKLELKAFEIAKQYNTIGEFTRDYNAAIIALDNFILDYPGTIYKEDALFYKFDSMYKLSTNSIPSKKQERLISAKTFYQSLVKFKADTKYLDKANKMNAVVENELKQYTN